MGIVHLLPENLINQIAAGEVVERPASVVKELIENSIDAEATEIIVDIEDGGRRLIRVSDNGCGMSREDALLSIQRHATSKIREVSDLFHISTLGFRGEALPSIASVSKLRLTTVPKGSTFGISIRLEGGKELEVIDSGGPVGTSMEVRELFFNTPARLKFMKSTTTEMSHITATVTRMAISYPHIRFIYNHNGSQIYNLPSSKDLLSRICKLIREDDKNLIEISLNSKISVSGYVSGPEINRPTQRETYIFVNGRFVRDRVVLHAVMDAYRTVMEKDRYPLAFLFLDVPPMDVDVNVHPAKTEVRFRNTDEIHRVVYAAVSEALKGWTARKGGVSSQELGVRSYESERPDYQDRVSEAIGRYAANPELAMRNVGYASTGSARTEQTPITLSMSKGKGFFSSLTVLGRVGGTYIICSRGNDLCLIDQHAAHERVAFERLKTIRDDSTPASQALLIPETVELNPSETGLLQDYTEVLAKAGIELEHFGGNTFVIKAVPAILSRKDVKGLIKDIVDELAHMERSSSFNEIMDRLFSRMACHSAIEGGDYMDPAEIKALLRDLDSIDFSSNCPHGRPVFVMLTQPEIEKMFYRR